MDELEIGFYSAVAIYGLIFTWTLLVRLRWLPVAVVRLVRRPTEPSWAHSCPWPCCERLSQVFPESGPGAGHFGWSGNAVFCPVSILAVRPYYHLEWCSAHAFVGDDVDDDESYGALSGNYYSYYDNDIVSGHDPHADISRPPLWGNVCSKL